MALASCFLLASTGVARADEPEDAPGPLAIEPEAIAPSDRDMAIHERDKTHAVFARWDLGGEGYSIGAGYIHLWEQADSYRGLGGVVWIGAGVDGRVFVAHDPGRVAGGGGFGTGRISFAGDMMGMSMEVGAGGADIDSRARAIATAGACISALYVDFGYTYQFPIDGLTRANAIASHMFTIRITVPVHTYEKVVEKTPVPVQPKQ